MNRLPLTFAVNQSLWNARWPKLALLGAVLCTSSCASASKYVKNTFQRGDREQAIASAEKPSQNASPTAKAAVADSELKSFDAFVQEEIGSTKLPEPKQDLAAMITRGDDPFATAPVIQTSAQVLEAPTVSPTIPAGPIVHDVPAREPIGNGFGEVAKPVPPFSTGPFAIIPECPTEAPCSARPFPGAELSRDEFICDGGDNGLPVHYQGLNRGGLELEDTVAEFKDHEGKSHVKASTQACIYAPRFGAVMSSTLPQQGMSIDKVAGHQDRLVAGGIGARVTLDEKVHTDEALGMASRSRASGVVLRQGEDHIHQAIVASNHNTLQNAFEDIRFIQQGQFELANTAVIGESINAALEWSDGRRPVIMAKDIGGKLVQGRATVQDMTGVEDKRTPGELQLIKVADKSSAQPGDVVTFTIRFDNIGERELFSVRVVDNLSPRLEFIEDSVDSNMDGKIDIADNGEGSHLLTFEFEQPLKGKTGGYLSFKCRVR
ncbi:DUF11 domain-containing protein [Planctomicrobium sp. SH668]|uniref:DUF11 domain-containing protein n=1 Tax=Planctomicrobium sp. SH668 TaxID=3448126 RepID=UPI003F5C729C